MNNNVLVVEDEPDVANLIRYHLRRAELSITVAVDGVEGLAIARTGHPDLIILDLMLPRMDGAEVCKALREEKETATIPILILTAKGTQEDRIRGLELGADDYVAKPFSPRELTLRVQSLLRRSADKGQDHMLVCGAVTINRNSFEAEVSGRKLDLTRTEFKLLSLLAERRGKIQSRETLLTSVWAYEKAIDTRTVDTHVRRLREKLCEAAPQLETVRGFGYRMSDRGSEGVDPTTIESPSIAA